MESLYDYHPVDQKLDRTVVVRLDKPTQVSRVSTRVQGICSKPPGPLVLLASKAKLAVHELEDFGILLEE